MPVYVEEVSVLFKVNWQCYDWFLLSEAPDKCMLDQFTLLLLLLLLLLSYHFSLDLVVALLFNNVDYTVHS